MSPDPVRLLRGTPYFLVADVAASGVYYRDVLGFHPEYVAGEEFAIHARDGCALMLRRAPEPDRIQPNEARGGTWDAFFWVTDVEALYEELRGTGAVLAYGLVEQPYGMKEFATRDPHGYVLGFGQTWPPGQAQQDD